MRILVIEDDERTASYLVNGLQQSGYIVDSAANGLLGKDMALEGIYDALIVDRLLPQLNGIELVKQLRANGVTIPILMLSALSSAQHKAQGLQAGCDDYLSKPYAFIELATRLEILLNRHKTTLTAGVLQVGDLQLDRDGRMVTRLGQLIHLQLREFLILEKLMLHAEQVVTRSMLLESAWNYDFDPKDNLIDKHIYKLRQKIDANFSTPLIHTIAGAGYMISSNYQQAT